MARIDSTEAETPWSIQALAAGQRHRERSAERDGGNGVEAAHREIFGAADEIARGIVDEAGSAPPLFQIRSSISSIAASSRMSQARPTILPPCAVINSSAV